MAEENNTSTTISEGTQTNARIQYFDIIEGTETKYNDVPVVVDDSQVYLNNPTNMNNILARTLKDVLFAKFDVKNINDKDYLMQSGYHDIDLDVWSVAQALANVTGDVNKRLYGIYDYDEDKDSYYYSKNNFLQKEEAKKWLEENTGFIVDQINQIIRGLSNTSLLQELLNLLNAYNAQIYGIPGGGNYLNSEDVQEEDFKRLGFESFDDLNAFINSNSFVDTFLTLNQWYKNHEPVSTTDIDAMFNERR